MFRLSSDIIFDLPTHLQHFQSSPEMKAEVQNFIQTSNSTEPLTTKKFEIHP